ncbi:hypothetical protein F5146DRAFT_18950 [Armillaria mellea]|nr:hypothetical protein F5146DRAFT_18950 [Armillaria mellea]
MYADCLCIACIIFSSLLSSHSGPATLLLIPNGWYLDQDTVISNGAGRSSSSPLLGTARVIEADSYLANHRSSQPEKSTSDTCLGSGGAVVLSPHASTTFQIWSCNTCQVDIYVENFSTRPGATSFQRQRYQSVDGASHRLEQVMTATVAPDINQTPSIDFLRPSDHRVTAANMSAHRVSCFPTKRLKEKSVSH